MIKRIWLVGTILLFTLTSSFAQEKSAVGLIETRLGEIYMLLYEETPLHKESFIQLASAGYWDSLTFNRVIPNFVAQGGCPDTEEGFNDPEYLLEPEILPELKHTYGAVGAGRDGNPDKISARCQFYIVQNKNGLHRLDGDYTVFGEVIQGMEVVDSIVHQKRDAKDQPVQDINLKISILYLSPSEIDDLKNK